MLPNAQYIENYLKKHMEETYFLKVSDCTGIMK